MCCNSKTVVVLKNRFIINPFSLLKDLIKMVYLNKKIQAGMPHLNLMMYNYDLLFKIRVSG
jgi:hypothetical protein